MKYVVVIADDYAAVHAHRFALRHAGGFRVVATLDGRVSVRSQIAELQPDVVLVNDMCQRTNVAARIREAAQAAPGCRVLLVSSRNDPNTVADAAGAGAEAVLPAGLTPAELAAMLSRPARNPAPRPQRAPAPNAALRLVDAHDAPAARTSA